MQQIDTRENIEVLKRDEAIVAATQIIKAKYASGSTIVERGTISVADGSFDAPPHAKTALVIYFS